MEKLISFDLQGTISSSKFSDEFWLEYVPLIYAQKNGLSLMQAKKLLEHRFKSEGPYHAKFYDHNLILNELLPSWDFYEVIGKLKNSPEIDIELIEIIKELKKHAMVILVSSTTKPFINYELMDHHKHFDEIYSTLDDFKIPGKPSSVYKQIAKKHNNENSRCLHIGDNLEMDVTNPQVAGWSSFHYCYKQDKADLMRSIEIQLCLNGA